MNRFRIPTLALALTPFLSCRTAPPPLPFAEAEPPVTQETFGAGGEDRHPEISPDGRHLFFATTAYSPDYEIYRKELGGTLTTRVLTSPGNEWFPRIHPKNPALLAFSSDWSGEWAVYVVNLEQKDLSPEQWPRISDEGARALKPSWSADGSNLVFCTQRAEGEPWSLVIADFTAGTLMRLDQVEGFLPDWSPAPSDGRIVFERMRDRDLQLSMLWTLRVDERHSGDLNLLVESSEWAAINPAWSPDGSWIVFATVGRSAHRRGAFDDADDLWIVSADGAQMLRLTTDPASDWMPAWSRSGRIYFLSDRSGSTRIWSLDASMWLTAER